VLLSNLISLQELIIDHFSSILKTGIKLVLGEALALFPGPAQLFIACSTEMVWAREQG